MLIFAVFQGAYLIFFFSIWNYQKKLSSSRNTGKMHKMVKNRIKFSKMSKKMFFLCFKLFSFKRLKVHRKTNNLKGCRLLYLVLPKMPKQETQNKILTKTPAVGHYLKIFQKNLLLVLCSTKSSWKNIHSSQRRKNQKICQAWFLLLFRLCTIFKKNFFAHFSS